MTPTEELSDIYEKAKTMYNGLIAMGCKATVLYTLEQVMNLCKGDPTPESVVMAKDMMMSLRKGSDNQPN